jgi:hypothetical protein
VVQLLKALQPELQPLLGTAKATPPLSVQPPASVQPAKSPLSLLSVSVPVYARPAIKAIKASSPKHAMKG